VPPIHYGGLAITILVDAELVAAAFDRTARALAAHARAGTFVLA
jgi:hypothetical protein